MVYCMSDIHGEYERYMAMLKQIRFSEKDTLYILGDCIDRFAGGIDILRDIMQRPNVCLIQGNHELMALAALGPDNLSYALQLWLDNGGSVTRNALMHHCTHEERYRILRLMRDAPDHLEIEVNGRQFHLVHGCLADNRNDRLWGRPRRDAPAPIPGTTVIVGHTPTTYLLGYDGKPFRIWYGNGIIDIDCGCGEKSELRRLGCLRLDDMKEFYI